MDWRNGQHGFSKLGQSWFNPRFVSKLGIYQHTPICLSMFILYHEMEWELKFQAKATGNETLGLWIGGLEDKVCWSSKWDAYIVFPCISSRWFSPKFPGHIKIPQVKPHFSHPNWRQNCGFFSHSGPLPHLAVLLILPNCSGRPGTSALPCQISSLGHPTGPWWIVWVGNLPNSWIMLDPRQDSEENWLTGDSEKRRANHGLRGSTPDESTRVISGGYLQKDPKSIQKCSKWN